FECSQCGRRFKDNGSLVSRQRRKHENREKCHKCPSCDKRFLEEFELRAHTRSVHTATENKPFGCSFCGKRFPDMGTYDIHMRSHTGEKPYACPSCPQRYRTKSNLTRHIKEAHTE